MLNLESNDSQQPTSKTLLNGITTNNRLPQNYENVNSKSQFSLKPSQEKAKKLKEPLPKVVQTKGVAQKQAANYSSDKVFKAKDVFESIRSVESFRHLPQELQKSLVDDIWIAYNSRKSVCSSCCNCVR